MFVDEAKKAVWSIDNPDAVKGFYGDKVTVRRHRRRRQEERSHRLHRGSKVGTRHFCLQLALVRRANLW